MRAKTLIVASLATLMLSAGAFPAAAACKKMGFTVNDYGKDGPTKDAKELLDKEIAKWAADNGIAKYTVGKKDVKCELFLDVILFDEHTCTASASVCWGEGAAGGADATKPKVEEAAPKKQPKAPVETGAIESEAATEPANKPADTKPAAKIETSPATPDAAERAAAAAERAAAAAERAATAAEKAAAKPAEAADPATQEPVSEAAPQAGKAP